MGIRLNNASIIFTSEMIFRNKLYSGKIFIIINVAIDIIILTEGPADDIAPSKLSVENEHILKTYPGSANIRGRDVAYRSR